MVPESATMPEADRSWMVDKLLALLQTPSPSGRTDAVMQLIGGVFDELGVPFTLTRRGALTAELPGESTTIDRAIVVHADTIGCMVRELKDNGRLELIPVGTFSARFAAGARVRIFTDDSDEFITGTVMPLKASGHAFGDEIDTQPTDWEHVEVRVDRNVSTRQDLVALGLNIGDFVAFITSPELTEDGFIVSRHLDGSHGWERSHLDSLEACYLLLEGWLQTPLTFASWDAKPSGKLRDFPSSEQPAPSEQWVPLSRGDFTEPGDVSPGEHWPPSEGPQA